MPATDAQLLSFNAGQVGKLALARVDLTKMRAAAEVQSNFLPHVLGPAMLRPGTEYIAELPDDAEGWLGEFYFDEETKALLVATAAGMQFLVDDAYVSRVAVGTVIANGDFATDLSDWTQSDEAGATSAWVAGAPLSLVGTGSNYAWRDQQVTVAGGDAGKEHGIRLVVAKGTVSLLVGTAQGDDSYWNLTLAPGTYSLALTPTGNFWIRLGGNDAFGDYVTSIAIEGAGPVGLPVPWAAADFGLIRYDQSGDVIFAACGSNSNTIGYQQMRIERHDADSRSWGIVLYQVPDGPFRLLNDSEITLAPSAIQGQITVTASRAVFQPGHVGALFQLTQQGQQATASLGGASQQTGTIRVTGLSNLNPGDPTVSGRVFSIVITGTFVGTVTLQQSLGEPGDWTDVKTWTAPASESYDDGLDNQIVFYQLAILSGDYTSGAADCTLVYAESAQTGICRVTAYTSATEVGADVLTEFGIAGAATTDWAEGEWSDYRGWPAAVVFHEGRLCWGTGLEFDGSVSDAYQSFDATVQGDSGPLDFTIATGGQDGLRWMLSLERLIAGTAAQEISIRSSALDEPLTPTEFVARDCSTRGGAKVRPIKVDQEGVFVGRNGQLVYRLQWNASDAYVDYTTSELTRLNRDITAAGIVDVAVQRQPDTRLWFVCADGSCAVLTYDADDQVVAWTPATTPNGSFERTAALPGDQEDDRYFIIARTIGGVTKRYIEKLAMQSECVGGTLNKTMDSHLVYQGAATQTLSAPHLVGQEVVVWADGAPLVTAAAPATVDPEGSIALPQAVENAVYGLPYTAQFQSAKLAYGGAKGGSITRQKRVDHVGLVMADTAPEGVSIGRDFAHLAGLPATYRGAPLTPGQVIAEYDDVPGPFNGGWYSDARVCIEVSSPYPCTLMGLLVAMTTNDGRDDGSAEPQTRQ